MERASLLASMTDNEKSMKNLVNDANLRLVGLLLPHHRIGESEGVKLDEIFPDRWVEVTSAEAPRQTGGVNIREPSDNPPALRAEADARAKEKETAPEQLEVESSDDEGICYSTLLDHLPIPEDLFSRINFFNLANSIRTLEDSVNSSSFSFKYDVLDAGSVSHLCLPFYACECSLFISLLGY